MTSLTRADATKRAGLLHVDAYDLGLDLDMGESIFGCVTRVRFRCADPGESSFIDLRPATVRSAVLNGRPLELGSTFDGPAGRLHLADLEAHNELVVDAVMAYSHDGEGLHRHVDPADGRPYLYAMSFLDAAPRWFACFDQPDLKAPVTLDVRCPDNWVVAGNGPAAELEPGHWAVAATGPLASYFTTLVAGPYHSVRDTHDGVPLVLHARRSLAEHLDRDAADLLSYTARCLDELHALFGTRYRWGEYHQAFVPELNAGAMENPGCVTLRDDMVFRARVTEADRASRRSTIAHEMAHMWFGDLVTMRWWDDLWLNESFAEYLGHRVCEQVTGETSWVEFGIAGKSWGYAADRRPSTHPVAVNGAADAKSALTEFDGISYAKGASVLRQLAVHLGDDIFLQGLRRYVSAHADGNAEFADLFAAWTAAGAVALDEWSHAWLRTTGLDILRVEGSALVRESAGGTPREHTVAVAAFAADGRELARNQVTSAASRTPVPWVALPDARLVLADAGDETWAKLDLPAPAWQAMAGVLPGIEDPRARVAVWNALQLALADAQIDPRLALDIVTAALPVETHDAIIATVGEWARRRLCGACLSDTVRGPALARIAGAMLAVIDVAAPGSGRQLSSVRLAIATTTDPALLRGWLCDDGLPPGLVMDAELRWAVLCRLAQLGEMSAAQLDDEAARDHSSQGAVHAVRCRTARPDAVAKREAWDALMGDASRPNYELYAMAEGFWDPDHRDLTDRYVDRYFSQIAATAALRSGWVVDRLALLTYPWAAVDTRTVSATQLLLANGELDAGIRRSVSDAGDDLGRALAVRERFFATTP